MRFLDMMGFLAIFASSATFACNIGGQCLNTGCVQCCTAWDANQATYITLGECREDGRWYLVSPPLIYASPRYLGSSHQQRRHKALETLYNNII